MADLDGKLKVFEPVAVLQMLQHIQATGELELMVDGNAARIYFERGNITYACQMAPPWRLGELLLRKRLVSEGDLKKVLERQVQGRRLGELLVTLGLIEAEQLYRAVVEQIKEVIYQTVHWRSGTFRFTHGCAPAAEDILINLSPQQLMLEGMTRFDEETREYSPPVL